MHEGPFSNFDMLLQSQVPLYIVSDEFDANSKNSYCQGPIKLNHQSIASGP